MSGIEQGPAFLQQGVERDEQGERETSCETERRPEKAVRCRECDAEITTESQRIEIDGSHQHAFFNPHGLLFEIGCFAEAPGTLSAGEPTADFSWFPGFAWNHALCAACGQHLGWRYLSSASGFYGLVLNRLQED